MAKAPSGYPPAPVPDRLTPARLRSAVQDCRACNLWADATQAVLGEGPRDARVMLVGEQPGDREDLDGHPFVGPAGRVLDEALTEAGLAHDDVYLTNAVKHFRHETKGKRRIHKRPDRWHVTACLPWLSAELELVKPEAVVCLGATAAQALLGSSVRIGRDRGTVIESDIAPFVTVTAHPSSVLRMPDSESRHRERTALAADLRSVVGWIEAGSKG